MKTLLSLVMLSLILVAVYPSQGQKVCEVNCFDTVPNCQIACNQYCLVDNCYVAAVCAAAPATCSNSSMLIKCACS